MKKRIWEEEKWLHFFTAGHSPLDGVARGREKKREEERRNVCLGKGRGKMKGKIGIFSPPAPKINLCGLSYDGHVLLLFAEKGGNRKRRAS